MLLEPHQKKLFIFAGQKDDYLSDMWEFDIATKTLTERFQNVASVGGPEACFAQRAVIDPSLQEIYVYVLFLCHSSARILIYFVQIRRTDEEEPAVHARFVCVSPEIRAVSWDMDACTCGRAALPVAVAVLAHVIISTVTAVS